MTRTSFRPVASLGLAAAILTYVGCTRTYETTDRPPVRPPSPPASTPEPSPAKVATPGKNKSQDKDPLALFASWTTRPPAAVLVISGEQHGYLQPCGCTDGQLGGLGRRYDLIAKLRARGWPVAAVDLGDLIQDPAGSRGGPEQEKIKFDTALKALAAMKYGAVAVGPEDLKLGIGETLGLLLNLKSPLFLAANLKPDEGFAGTIRPFTVLQAGPVAIGVTAVIDPAAFGALNDPDKVLLTLQTPDDALPAALAGIGPGPSIRVLMVQGPIEEGRRLAAKFPAFQIVITTSKAEDPDAQPETVNDGRTQIINVGKKGKYAGVVGLFPGSDPVVRYVRQPLESPDFTEAEPIRALIDVDYQTVLKSVGAVANYRKTVNAAYPAGSTYVGAESCKDCHPRTFEKWATTKHARAFESLVNNPKRNRAFDAECISCHTTGFRYTTGWTSAEATPHLKGNQCENCHGPASLHVAEPTNLDYRKPMAMSADAARNGNFCISCHNEDNDHDFKFDARYNQIFHKGLDTYDDPKVRQGRPPKVAAGGK